MKTNFSHLALLVPSVEDSAKFLSGLGIACEKLETFEDSGTKEIYVGKYSDQEGLLLLVEPLAKGPYRRAMDKRGPGLHHIALDVLDLSGLVSAAQKSGWELHPISQHTMAESQTAWLFCKGIPTLIEVHQVKSLFESPYKISKLKLPMKAEQMKLFEGLGLGELVSRSESGLKLTVDGIDLSFDQIACI